MSIPAAERLRVLVNDYYHGLLTFDSYRDQRGRLLDTLGADTRPAAAAPKAPTPREPENTQKRAHQPAPTPASTPPPPPPPPAAAAAPERRRSAAPVALAAGTAVVVAGALVAYWQLRPSGEAPAAATDEIRETSNLSPGEALLERFVQRNAWDQDSARTLALAWSQALAESDRQVALASASYRRFSDVLRRRLREEEALAAGNASPELETLQTLATDLGVRSGAAPAERTAERAVANPPAPSVRANEQPIEPAAVTSAAPAPEPSPATTTASATPPPVAAPAPTPTAPIPTTPPVAAPAPAPAPATAAATTAPASAAQPSATDAATATARSAACSAQLLNTRRPLCNDTLSGGGNGPTLAIVRSGEYAMGDDQVPNARPAHRVVIDRPFAMSQYEISFAEFRAYCTRAARPCPANPWSDETYPVVAVSWTEAAAYAEWLSAETGQRYALPSETQWEYAARAGSTTPYPFGDNVTPAAARSSAYGAVTSPVPSADRSVNGNAFRLWHMIGNVREWVADVWHEDHEGAPADGSVRSGEAGAEHVVRGGSYADGALPLKSAARLGLAAGTQDPVTGFRVVRELTP